MRELVMLCTVLLVVLMVYVVGVIIGLVVLSLLTLTQRWHGVKLDSEQMSLFKIDVFFWPITIMKNFK